MGLETLIVILVILIIGILADGVRRMLKERSSRLHLRIDPKARELARQPHDDTNPELPSGGARVARSATSSARRTPGLGNLDGMTDERKAPPLVMEPEEEVPPSVTTAVQVDLFAGEQTVAEERAVAESEPEHIAVPEQPVHQPEPPPVRDVDPELLEVIVLHMVTPPTSAMPGRELLQALLEQGLRYGDMHIFHRHVPRGGRDELQFSMANALEPGTFDIDAMESQTFRAMTFFLKMPGPSRPAEALEKMISVVRQLAERFGGEVRDDKHSVLTQQTTEHMRERVQEFERRQRVAGV